MTGSSASPDVHALPWPALQTAAAGAQGHCMRPLQVAQLPAEPALTRFQKVLLVTDGSVTELLQLCSTERVRVRKLAQERLAAAAAQAHAPLLQAQPLEALLARTVLLVAGAQALVHAQSLFRLERLSAPVREALLHTDEPVGRIWTAGRTEMYREVIDMRLETRPVVAQAFALPPGTPLVARTYRLWCGGAPMGLIAERFPQQAFAPG